MDEHYTRPDDRTAAEKPRRLWQQFSLRTLLIGVTLSSTILGIALVWLYPRLNIPPRSRFFEPPSDDYMDDRHGNEILYFQRERTIHVIVQSLNRWRDVSIAGIEPDSVEYRIRSNSIVPNSPVTFTLPLRSGTLCIALPGVATEVFDLPNVDLKSFDLELRAAAEPVLSGTGCIQVLRTSKSLPPAVRHRIADFLASHQ